MSSIQTIQTIQTIQSFKELIQDEKYNWALYFYHLESRQNRSTLENALLQSYQIIKGDNIDRCCCNEGDKDDGPIPFCGPECCTREPCSKCSQDIRICRDVWFSVYHGIICFNCYEKS